MINQPRFKTISVSKDTFVTLFLILFLVLMFMPFLATFNDILTRIVINLRGYWFIREVIVPFEVRVVAVVLAGRGLVIRSYLRKDALSCPHQVGLDLSDLFHEQNSG